MLTQTTFEETFGFKQDAADAPEMLKYIANNYPFFGLAHFYYLQSKWQSKTYTNEEAAKAALHFNNLFLLNRRLNSSEQAKNNATIDEAKKDEEQIQKNIEEAQFPSSSYLNTNLQEHEMESESEAAEPVIKNDIGEMISPVLAAEEPGMPISQLDLPENGNKVIMEEAQSPLHAAPSRENPIEDATLPIFEPLHTTDYFASQGIKLSEALATEDRLDKQLRSFTGWLKTMKKLQKSYKTDFERPIDSSVQQLADNSNLEEDVVTETMAEAYLQQGKPQKAREIYEKLSLLNPDKSSYFAALLEKIK